MFLFSHLSHAPQACADALRSAAPGSEVFVDLETTGLGRHHEIVSVGVLVGGQLFILFTGSHELSVAPLNINIGQLRQAMAPLAERSDLIIVFHNATFDLGFLKRAGIDVRAQIRDTGLMLILVDPDRKREGLGRMLRRFSEPPSYRLKDATLHLLNIAAPHFPGSAAALDYHSHVRYLASDCLITRELHRSLVSQLQSGGLEYYDQLVAPVTPLLVDMSNAGIQADPEFLQGECYRLTALMCELSQEHERQFAQRLDVGDFGLRGWVYLNHGGLRCYLPTSDWVLVGKKRVPPLDVATLQRLYAEADNCRKRESLPLVLDYLLARSLLVKLATLRDKHVDPITGRIHTTLNDWQSSGRISSTNPNLQAIAKTIESKGRKSFASDRAKDVVVRSRNALIASDGYMLVACDIAQADIRALAHVVEASRETGSELIERLEREREARLERHIGRYSSRLWDHYRPENRKPVLCPRCAAPQPVRRQMAVQHVQCIECRATFDIDGRVPHFDPEEPNRLADDFRRGGSDFYTTATARMLGRPPRDKSERNAMKQTILGIVNGMSARGLAVRLDVDVPTAQTYLDRFADAYPKETAYIDLMHHAAAITGYCTTFMGRRRRVTPHYWMVNLPEVELLLSYRGADKLWVRVVPLAAGRHALTCWVKSVIDARYDSPRLGQEIYHDEDGRISEAPYRFFEDDQLVFRLPVRNIAWRLIRRVRIADEESRYQGFDKTRRQLANHIFQGSTADIARLMMIRSQPVCRTFNARMLLQIHDELLFEVPGSEETVMEFVRDVVKVLQEPPSAEFRVPILVEPKIGKRFGELRELELSEYSPA